MTCLSKKNKKNPWCTYKDASNGQATRRHTKVCFRRRDLQNHFCFYLFLFFWGHQSLSSRDEISPVLLGAKMLDVLIPDIWTCNHNKSESFDHNILALAVTTLTTKVSTRYIRQPLEVDQAYFFCHIGNQWQANYLWKSIHCVEITGARAYGGLCKRVTTQIMHSQSLQSDMWLTLRHVCACSCALKCNFHSYLHFFPSALNNNNRKKKKNERHLLQ